MRKITVQVIGNISILGFMLDDHFDVLEHVRNDVKALCYAIDKKPDIIIFQYDFENDNSAEFINALFSKMPECKIILVGNELADEAVIECIVAGCSGYLEFNILDHFLIKAIKSVYRGEAWISRKMVAQLIEEIRG